MIRPGTSVPVEAQPPRAGEVRGRAAVVRDEEVVAVAAVLGRRLAAAGLRVATVESCTGGLVAAALTETAGSSAWFERGFVTYTNEAKQELVGVDDGTLAAHGAVSEATAAEMACGGLRASRAHWALSITGIAGPSGAVPGKPLGTVCFGWAGPGGVETETHRFAGDRASVRRQAALRALEGALQRLSG